MTRFENAGVIIWEKVWLENSLKPSHSSYLSAYEDETDRVFQNVSISNSDASELLRRKHTTFRKRRKFEIKNMAQLMARSRLCIEHVT
jgi:hypothetical protein